MSRKKQPTSPQSAPALSRQARLGITAFILLNLFAIVSWCVPLDLPLIARCREIARPYLVFTGLFQKWDMFAPDPSKLNIFVGAMVSYRNGESSVYFFPRMENLGYAGKYFKERYRKYANDNLRLDSYSALWPDAARYIARQYNRPSNPPRFVGLVRYWSIVPPPGPKGEQPSAEWQQHLFYLYPVKPGDLE